MRPLLSVTPALFCALLLTLSTGSAAAREIVPEQQVKPSFNEIWAYLLQGEQDALNGQEPITHICYVGASLALDGRIRAEIARPTLTLRDGLHPQVDLVVAELTNASLLHFAMDPQYGVLPLLVDDICRVAQPFDGVQIDFEAVARADAASFVDFLWMLRARLPATKMLSVALPARTATIADAYDYTQIAPIVDRVIIMAYDEHWSGSAPGPIASLSWCARVVDYTQSVVPPDKIVMGLPLYGRAWQDKRLARALRFKNVQDLMEENGSVPRYAPEQGSSFEYSQTVVVTVYYDDVRTLLDKLELYRSRGVASVSFWRIGEGTPDLWDAIDRADAGNSPAAGDPAPADQPQAASPLP